ncbi:MAG: asparaginase [Pseudomonadota bacterium]
MSAEIPVGVEVWRGTTRESRHRVSVAVADAGGRLVLAIGDVRRPVYPRSALKPIQALPLVETGAADAFGLSDAELALACASHGGEPMHVDRVRAWLARIGLDETALACGAHDPSYAPAARVMIADHVEPTAAHNNCSGKHAGMLTTARHLGEPTAGYLAADHPVQRRIKATLEAFAETSVGEPGIDGCSVPTWPLPLADFARAMARFGGEGAATTRIARAMRAHPELVAGTGRACTALMTHVPQLLAKTGAEGVYAACLLDHGLGIALKVEDGNGRADPVALLAVIERLAPGAGAAPALAAFRRPVIRNVVGTEVGYVQPAEGWPPR